MRLLSAALLLASPIALLAQPSAPEPAPQAASTAITLQPALDAVRQSLLNLRLDRWKGPRNLRDETDTNVTSIRRDLDNTLPPLVAAADAAPSAVSPAIPVLQNISALYDVLLRVSEAARIAAPQPQIDSLQQAMSALESARRTLGDRLQTTAQAQEHQITDLKASLRAASAPPQPAAPTTAATTTSTTNHAKPKKKPTPKPAAKPATPPPTN